MDDAHGGRQKGGEGSVQQKVDKMTGGTVIGTQIVHNYPPTEPRPPDNAPKKRGISKVLVAIIGGLFTLTAAVMAIVPGLLEQRREQAAMDMTSSAAQVFALASQTPLATPPAPTATTSLAAVPIAPTARAASALALFVENDLLTLHVAANQSLNLAGLSFRVVTDTQGAQRNIILTDDFDVLKLTNGTAEPGACFVYRLGAAPLQSACRQPNRVFERSVARADAFWRDFAAGRLRAVQVLKDGRPVATCPAESPECPITYP